MPARKVFVLLPLYVILYTFFASPNSVSAFPALPTPLPCQNGPWYNQTQCQFTRKVGEAPEQEIFGERYTVAQINWILNSLVYLLNPTAGLTGVQLQNVLDQLGQFLTTQKTPPTSPLAYSHPFPIFAKLGIPGLLVGSLPEISAPASGIQDINNTLAKFDLASPVHAQGYGYSASTGLQSLWRAARNISYLFMIILLIIAGFMIMFRVKVNPQTAVTLQLMVPKIVFTLLGITFSYAIAGLVIDLVYVLLAFVLALMGSVGVFTSSNTINVIRWFTTPDFAQMVYYYLVGWWAVLYVNAITATTSVLGGIVVALTGAVIALFLFIASIFIMFILLKVWWMMLKSYLNVMFLIIVGPIYILFGLLPTGNLLGFGSWLRQLVAHASVFLVVPLMFALNIIVWSSMWQDRLGITPSHPFGQLDITLNGTYPDFPLFGSKGWLTGLALGFAILALIPKTAEMIRDSLKVQKFAYGTAFGEVLQQPYSAYQGFVAGQQARGKVLNERQFMDLGALEEIRTRAQQFRQARSGSQVKPVTGGDAPNV
ncbi:hypothetical protein A2634_03005 [Candidatus Amesbacteria bacterium RIFCSPHIGHO2_01_FULL_48_32]|uniref:Uncharacterized protein n=1 Tax=Candidatus Amesbacteria bacterium RIFCSPLOWO2_01_FULL_48_25 TaxID=1797259 RepID=A0A1F4Z9V5_9BACT|nr:MAG: hypothetical protein A2634_03005 [Candidatus Amesbacteria bacterium RIFCSPHIGHO2_01_FULL_48_32]OGD03110.1 MAG: hypothetical protein A2989_02225 [Candidatus Amesbacteria bacterium RIFCSPLOWO2_01_FULL_48_25]